MERPKERQAPQAITQPMFVAWAIQVAEGMLAGMKKPPTPGKELEAFAHTATVIAEKVTDAAARRHQAIAQEQMAALVRAQERAKREGQLLGPDGAPARREGSGLIVPSIVPPEDVEETKN